MFGLAHQIKRDPVGVVVFVGDHQDLGRASDHVDPDLAKDAALGGCDKCVAGAGDLVHGGDALGAIGQRCDRLGAADAVNLIHPGNPRGQQHQRIEHPIGGGYGDGEAFDPGDLGRNGVHQHRRGVGGKPARHIQPGSRDCRPAPAKGRARRIGPCVVPRQLPLVIGADALGRQFQRLALLCGHA